MKAAERKEMGELFARARAAGLEAAAEVVPIPMIVVERANPLDDASPIMRKYAPIMDGVCGFAWIKIRPARGPFVSYLKSRGMGKADSYEGGYMLWVSEFNQSLARKEAYAGAFAMVLNAAGLNAYSMSRMD
jgi:hypothetical protein